MCNSASAAHYFDFIPIAREAEISPAILARICDTMRREFRHDDMMYELHVLRVCMAVRDGLVSLNEVFVEEFKAVR